MQLTQQVLQLGQVAVTPIDPAGGQPTFQLFIEHCDDRAHGVEDLGLHLRPVGEPADGRLELLEPLRHAEVLAGVEGVGSGLELRRDLGPKAQL